MTKLFAVCWLSVEVFVTSLVPVDFGHIGSRSSVVLQQCVVKQIIFVINKQNAKPIK